MMSRHLLPPNRTPLEAALADATVIDIDPTPLRHLADSTRCPTALLPWLAWAMSVDGWDEAIAEQPRRQLLRRSIEIHKRKGTAGAVRRALGALGVTVDFKEWQVAGGVPYTFQLTAWANDNPADTDVVLSEKLYQRLKRVVDQTKNERSHYAFRIGARFDGGLRLGNAAQARQLSRRTLDAKAVQLPAAVQPLVLGNAGSVRCVHHHSADARAVAVLAASPFAIASAARIRSVVHVTMETYL